MDMTLEPCPFCGGEAEVDWFYLKDEPWKVHVCCRKCAGNIYERARTHYHDCINRYESAEEAEAAAVKEWNTRYKRTCKLIMHDGSPACSECLAEQDYDARFCDQCGAEVADD